MEIKSPRRRDEGREEGTTYLSTVPGRDTLAGEESKEGDDEEGERKETIKPPLPPSVPPYVRTSVPPYLSTVSSGHALAGKEGEERNDEEGGEGGREGGREGGEF